MDISITSLKFKYSGGMERYLLDIVQGFHNQNITPKIYACKFDSSLKEYKYIQPNKVNLSFIPKKFRIPFLSYFISKNKKENEIILAISHILNSDILFCGGQHKGYLNAFNREPNLLERYKIYLEKKAFLNAKIIVAHSELMKKELIEFYNLDSNKITVIYPPVNTENFKIVDEVTRKKVREKFGFSENEIIYLFPSTGHSRKGFDILKPYFENSDLPIKLVVAGTPVKESKRIKSLGFCKNMPELYQAADFTIMASKYEPFGLVGIESILCGTPVVFSDNMGCSEVFNDQCGFLFNRNIQQSLNDAIIKSVNNRFRVNEPFSVLKYNPMLGVHIENLNKLIDTLK